jgi:hypothetical protein
MRVLEVEGKYSLISQLRIEKASGPEESQEPNLLEHKALVERCNSLLVKLLARLLLRVSRISICSGLLKT